MICWSVKAEMKKIKVLVSAYACEPDRGSEPGVGWNWARQISRFAETWVITRVNNKETIKRELLANPNSNLHFIYYDVQKWLSFWKKRTRGLYLYYLLWQIGVYRLGKKLNKEKQFDIVHHITFGNLWLPTFMPLLNIPFIWGPIGGGEQISKTFRKGYYIRSKIKEISRDIILNMSKVNLLFLYTSNKANIIITKTKDTADKIPNSNKKKVIVTTDVAVNSDNIKLMGKARDNLQIIAVGRLDAWRGFDLLIKTLPRIKGNNEVKLLILGEGSDKTRLQNICKDEKLGDSVIFAGQVEKEKYFEYLSSSSIFVNPNLKEGGVTVLFDALSSGLPVICMDIPGSAEIINDDCGIKIKPIDPEQTVSELAAALMKLVGDPDLRKKMGEAGRKRVQEHYTWEKKGEFIRQVYEKVLINENPPRP